MAQVPLLYQSLVSLQYRSPVWLLISSRVRELMETGKYSTLQLAMDQVRTQMGLPVGTPVLADFIANNNSAMHTAAQNIASLMGSQMSQVLGTNGTSTTIDVNRYRAMMGTIICNLSSANVQPDRDGGVREESRNDRQYDDTFSEYWHRSWATF